MLRQIVIGLMCINFFLFSTEYPTDDWETLSADKRHRIHNFFESISHNNVKFVEGNIHLVSENYTPYWNPIGFAIKYNRLEVLKLFIAAQAPLDNIIKGFRRPNLRYSREATALCHAAIFEHKECIKLLLEVGADPSIPERFKKNNGKWMMNSLYGLLHLFFVERSNKQEDHKFFEDIYEKYTIKPYKNEQFPKQKNLHDYL